MRLDNAQMKTPKSQLRLRPSFNELIKEITKEEYKNKNIRDVIDRNAYYFRDRPLGTVYDNNTVDLRQQHFQKILEQPKKVPHFDMAKDDEMDGLRDGSIQTLSASMDDAEEQHERQISQVSKRVSSKQIADLQERAQRARQLDEDDWQSVANAKSGDDDLPPLEDLQPKRFSNLQKARAILQLKRFIDEDKDSPEPKRVSNLQKARIRLKLKRFIDEDKDSPEPIEIQEAEKRREQTRDNADISSTVPQRQTRTHKQTIHYSIDINHWKGSTVKEEDILFQLHFRGAGLTEEQEQQYSNTKKKGKGKKETGRTYLVGLVEKLINSGKWTTEVNDELLRKRMNDWRNFERKRQSNKGKKHHL